MPWAWLRAQKTSGVSTHLRLHNPWTKIKTNNQNLWLPSPNLSLCALKSCYSILLCLVLTTEGAPYQPYQRWKCLYTVLRYSLQDPLLRDGYLTPLWLKWKLNSVTTKLLPKRLSLSILLFPHTCVCKTEPLSLQLKYLQASSLRRRITIIMFIWRCFPYSPDSSA